MLTPGTSSSDFDPGSSFFFFFFPFSCLQSLVLRQVLQFEILNQETDENIEADDKAYEVEKEVLDEQTKRGRVEYLISCINDSSM
jgi:hypothetical protein